MMIKINISTGKTYFIYVFIQGFTLRPLPVFASATKLSQPQPFLLVQNNTKMNEPIGNNKLETIKSSKSNTPVPEPNGSKPDHKLKPSTHGIDNTNKPMPATTQIFLRDQPVMSCKQAKMFSNTAKIVESAANERNKKNKLPHN